MGEYFCEVCKFYDDDVRSLTGFMQNLSVSGRDLGFNLIVVLQIEKGQYHCDVCGICRSGNPYYHFRFRFSME
ncbi:hypothetical protein KSP39_PZI009182 [Platanthera zijinensis]|uniref:CTCHY-type domain-containing protein n=1 Tax=Platanthera zijinensis TaxID=2320716 RepID=A0AAP0BM10_9ASPA